jgi:hypothetical protein
MQCSVVVVYQSSGDLAASICRAKTEASWSSETVILLQHYTASQLRRPQILHRHENPQSRILNDEVLKEISRVIFKLLPQLYTGGTEEYHERHPPPGR